MGLSPLGSGNPRVPSAGTIYYRAPTGKCTRSWPSRRRRCNVAAPDGELFPTRCPALQAVLANGLQPAEPWFATGLLLLAQQPLVHQRRHSVQHLQRLLRACCQGIHRLAYCLCHLQRTAPHKHRPMRTCTGRLSGQGWPALARCAATAAAIACVAHWKATKNPSPAVSISYLSHAWNTSHSNRRYAARTSAYLEPLYITRRQRMFPA
jgi:hypothetical protein